MSRTSWPSVAYCGRRSSRSGKPGEPFGFNRLRSTMSTRSLRMTPVDASRCRSHGRSAKYGPTLLGMAAPTSSATVDELADDLLLAIEDKSKKYAAAQRAKLLLALDAIRAPGFAQHPVIDAFREHHGERIADLSYQAIW